MQINIYNSPTMCVIHSWAILLYPKFVANSNMLLRLLSLRRAYITK